MDTEKRPSLFERKDTFWIFALLCAALWSSATVCTKVTYGAFSLTSADTADLFLFVGMRFLIAGALTVGFFSLVERRWLLPRTKGEWKHSVILSFAQVSLLYAMYSVGVATASGVMAVMINSTSTFFTILLAGLLFRTEKLTLKKLFACLLGFSAIYVMNIGGFSSGIRFTFRGEGLLLVSQALAGYAHNLTKDYTKTDSPVLLCGWQFLIGGATLALVGLCLGGRLRSTSPAGWPLLFYLAFVAASAFTMWDTLMKYHPVSKVNIFQLANPVFGVLFSAVLLGETKQAFRPATFLALALVAAGILLVNNVSFRKKNRQ